MQRTVSDLTGLVHHTNAGFFGKLTDESLRHATRRAVDWFNNERTIGMSGRSGRGYLETSP